MMEAASFSGDKRSITCVPANRTSRFGCRFTARCNSLRWLITIGLALVLTAPKNHRRDAEKKVSYHMLTLFDHTIKADAIGGADSMNVIPIADDWWIGGNASPVDEIGRGLK